MPLKKQIVRRALMRKFGFVEVEGAKHEAVTFFVQGRKVASTRFSRGQSEIADNLLGRMAQQIGVNLATFKGMIECTVGPQEYLRLLRQRHPERFG